MHQSKSFVIGNGLALVKVTEYIYFFWARTANTRAYYKRFVDPFLVLQVKNAIEGGYSTTVTQSEEKLGVLTVYKYLKLKNIIFTF